MSVFHLLPICNIFSSVALLIRVGNIPGIPGFLAGLLESTSLASRNVSRNSGCLRIRFPSRLSWLRTHRKPLTTEDTEITEEILAGCCYVATTRINGGENQAIGPWLLAFG